MPSTYVRELSVGEIMRSSVRIYRQNFLRTFLAYVLPNLPGAAIVTYGQLRESLWIMVPGYLVFLCGVFVSYVAITFIVSDACVGNLPNLQRSLTRTQGSVGSLALVSLLQVLIVFGGFVLLIVPGIVFLMWFVFAPIIVVLEGRTGKSALGRSKALTRGFFWRNFAVAFFMAVFVFVWYLLAIALSGILLGVVGALVRFSPQEIAAASTPLGLLIAAVTYPLLYVSLILTYYDLRARKEQYDTLALAAELGR